MPKVDRYRVVVYGASADKPNVKAKVELYTRAGDSLASTGRVRFHSGDNLPKDINRKGDITMNLPSDQLSGVVDLLRNEKPVYFAFHEGRAVIGTGIQPIGASDVTEPRLVAVVEKPNGPEPLEEPTPPSDA